MNKKIYIFCYILIIFFIGLILYLPKNHTTVLHRIDKPFEITEIIKQVSIDDKTLMTLYLNQNGMLNAVVTKQNVFFTKIQKISGHHELVEPFDLKQGDTRVSLHITWYNEGTDYIIYGIIKDNAVSTVEYMNYTLSEFRYNNSRVVYGFGKGIHQKEYKLYDTNGVELSHWKE